MNPKTYKYMVKYLPSKDQVFDVPQGWMLFDVKPAGKNLVVVFETVRSWE